MYADVNRPSEAQIFLTRKCNLNCGYCNLVNHELRELELSDWVVALANLKRFGIRTVKLLGGEPTVKPWLPELVAYANRIGLKAALLSNSSFDDTMFERLLDAGLWGYYASVDSLDDITHVDEYSNFKSSSGYAMLKRFQAFHTPVLAANVVIHQKNFREVPEVVSRLSDEGFYVNVCTIQHTRDPRREFSRTDFDPSTVFSHRDRGLLESLATQLLALKRAGVKLSVPEVYLRGIPQYGIECDWQCNTLSQLRIDADGGLMLCNEYRTELASSYRIDEIDEDAYLQFMGDWHEVRRNLDCDGCYWSCFVQAEENLNRSAEEFQFAARPYFPIAYDF